MPSVCSQRTADNKFEFGLPPTSAIVSNVGVAAQSPGMRMEIRYARNLTTLQITYWYVKSLLLLQNELGMLMLLEFLHKSY